MRKHLSALIVVLLCLVLPLPAAAGITVKIGYPAGGGFDNVGRLFARHFGKHLPGAPSITVQNVPGGGSMKLAELMQAAENPDGSVIGMVNASMATAPLLDPEAAALTPLDYQWIGSLTSEALLCFTSKQSGIASVEAFRTGTFKFGASNRASTTYLLAALARNLLGAKFDIVLGFEGIADIDAAIERGEIAGRCSSPYSYLAAANRLDDINLIARAGDAPTGPVAGVPGLADLAASDFDRQAIEVVTGALRFHHPFLLPPATPAAVVETYRKAFDAMVVDPEFLADAAVLGIELAPNSGARVSELVKEIHALPPAVVERARELIR